VSAAGVILAAGESRRMGFPKALLEYRGETFLDRLIGLFARRCTPVIVVTGAHAERIRAGCARADEAEFVVNAEWPRGQLTSLQCGLRAVPAAAEGALYTLVDHPAVMESTVAALLEPAAGLLRIPRRGGRRGHPVWIGRPLFAEFLAETGAARDVVHRHVDDTRYFDVDDAGILADIDDAEAYRALTGGTP
jgi:molybdenum cofactor cytidylyltransferase